MFFWGESSDFLKKNLSPRESSSIRERMSFVKEGPFPLAPVVLAGFGERSIKVDQSLHRRPCVRKR